MCLQKQYLNDYKELSQDITTSNSASRWTMTSAAKPYFELDSYSRPLGSSKPPTVTLQAVSTKMSPVFETQQADKEHQARHKQRIRIIRGIQHLLTALVSLGVALLQGRTYLIYQQTKNVPGAWPSFPDLLPILMSLSIAVAATIMDLCSLIAYAWPQSRAGHVAYKLASETRYAITTFKAISYTYSAVGSRVTCNQGNATGQNNDLWSWTCSAKADQMASVNQASSNCLSSKISFYLSIANIGVEVIGIIIDSIVKIDEARWARKSRAAHDDSDMKPLLISTGYQGTSGANNTKHKYSRLTDDQLDKLDKYEGDADKYMKKQSSNMDGSKMDSMGQTSYGY